MKKNFFLWRLMMRYKNLFLLLLVILLIDSGNIFCQEKKDDPDDYGRLMLQVVDEDSGESAREVFIVMGYPIEKTKVHPNYRMFEARSETDDKGFYNSRWKPGKYLLKCDPKSKDSEYAIDPNPFLFDQIRHEVTIEKGKITVALKKAYKAGRLQLIFIDKMGGQISFENYPEYVRINDKVEQISPDGSFTAQYSAYVYHPKDIMTGNTSYRQLFPARYFVDIDFEGLGYGSIRIKDIAVNKEETTKIHVVVDLEDQTGVYGTVTGLDGLPAQGIQVIIIGEKDTDDDFNITADNYTDVNGRYRICGLKEGSYDMSFTQGHDYSDYEHKLLITKNKMIKMNYQMVPKNIRKNS